MKKNYLLLIVLFIALFSNAQVTLTKVFNEPKLGDITSKNLYDSIGVVPKNVGANQVWDFSGYAPKSSIETSNYIAPTSAPSGSSYTGVTFVESYGSGNYLYMKVTPTRYELVGVQNPSFKLNLSSNAATEFMWPISMGYSLNDAFSGTANANNMNGNVSGNASTLGCGTGTLILPDGTQYDNILQVKLTLSAHASFLFGLTTVDLKLIQYMYYAANNKFPLLTVIYTDVTGAYTSKSADIKVNSAIVGIDELVDNEGFSVFPNPNNGNFTLKYDFVKDITEAEVMVEDVTGKLIYAAKLNVTNRSINMDLSNTRNGIYFVKVISNKEIISVNKVIINN